MVSPIALPVARLRHIGARVHTILGHDPLTTGSHPGWYPNWNYGIEVPEELGKIDIADLLYSYDHTWEAGLGEVVAYMFRDGRIIVYGREPQDPQATKPEHRRAHRRAVENDVATMLARIASVLEAKMPATAATGEDRA